MGKKAIKEMYPMQQGDVPKTYANINGLIKDFGYIPEVKIQTGIQSFINWYKSYYY